MVEIGDTVKVLFFNDKEMDAYTIKPSVLMRRPVWTGSHEGKRDNYTEEYLSTADIHKKEISAHTPLAKALLGRKVGDFFSYNVGLDKIRGRIIEVTKNKL